MKPKSGRARKGFVAIALAIATKGRSSWLNAFFSSAPAPETTQPLKTKNTARMRQRKAAKWFQWSCSPLKTNITITVKTVREITSWITFNWRRLKGPPLSWKPILLAGTVRQYSKNAMPQENRMTRISGQSVDIFSC